MANNETQVSAESPSASSIGARATMTANSTSSESAMTLVAASVTRLSPQPSPIDADQSAVASAQSPTLVELPNGDGQSLGNSNGSVSNVNVPPALGRAQVAHYANNYNSSNTIALGEPPDDDGDGAGAGDDEQEEQQEERELGANSDREDLLSRRLFGAEELKKLKSHHRAKLFAAQSALSRRRKRRKNKLASKANKSQNATTTMPAKNFVTKSNKNKKKRAGFLGLASNKSTQTRQGSTTVGYDSFNAEAADSNSAGDDLITLALTESPVTGSLRQHLPSLVNPLQLPSSVQKLFASSKLSSQLRGRHQSSGRNRHQQLLQQQQLSALLAASQAGLAGETDSSSRLVELLSGPTASFNWGDSASESSAIGSAVSAIAQQHYGHEQRDKMIPVEIIGLDPAVTNSILEGAAYPAAQMFDQQSSSSNEDQAGAYPGHSHHHHHHHHQQQNPLHSAAKGASQAVRPQQQQHLVSPTKAHSSIIHIHHFHTQAGQPQEAGQSPGRLLQQAAATAGHDAAELQQPEAAISNGEASESNTTQQQQVNDKDEPTYMQMDEQGGNNRTQQIGASSGGAEQDKGNGSEQQLQVINGDQQESQAQQEQQAAAAASAQEQQPGGGEQHQQLVMGSSVGQSNLSHSSHLPTAATSTNSTRSEANSNILTNQQQVSVEGQSAQIGRASLARGNHNAPSESDSDSNTDRLQQQMLMVAYKPQQARNSTTLSSAPSPLVDSPFSGNYFPARQQQPQQQQSPFNEGQESMSSASLALAKQLTAGGQQLVRGANSLLGRPFNATLAAPTAPNLGKLASLRANSQRLANSAGPETLLFEQLSPAELATFGLSSEPNSSSVGDSFAGQPQHFLDTGSGRVPFGYNSAPKYTRPAQQQLMLFDQLEAGKQQLAFANAAGNPSWPPTAPYAALAASNNLFSGQQQQQQNIIGNLALLRQMQQANTRNNNSLINKNLQATRANDSLTKLTNEELLALLNELKSTASNNNNKININAAGGQRNARPSSHESAGSSSSSKQLASSLSSPAANKFELAQASNQLPPKYLKSQLVSSANNATTIAAHNGYQQQQKSFNSNNKDHKSSGALSATIGQEPAAPTTHHNSQRAQFSSGQQLNKHPHPHQHQHHYHASQAPTIVGAESTGLGDDSSNGLSTVGLAFIFAVSLLTLTIIAASMIYRHRRRSVGRCADLAGRSRLNLTQRTKHFMRSNFVSPSDVTSIKSISTEAAGAPPMTAAGQSAAGGCKLKAGQGLPAAAPSGGKQQPSFIHNNSNLRGQQQHDAISRYTSAKQSFGGQTATLSTFSGLSEKYQVFGASGVEQTTPTQADIKTLNTRLQRPSHLRTLISSQESLNGVGGGKHSRPATDRVGGNSNSTGCYLNIRHRSANLLGAGKHQGSRKESRGGGGDNSTACRRSHSFQKLNCDPSQNHRASLKGPSGRMATIHSVSTNNNNSNSNATCGSTTFGMGNGRPHCQSPPNHHQMIVATHGNNGGKHSQGGSRGRKSTSKLIVHQDNFAQIDRL